MFTPIDSISSRAYPVPQRPLLSQSPQQMLEQAQQYKDAADQCKRDNQAASAEDHYKAAQKLFERARETHFDDPQTVKIFKSIYSDYNVLLKKQQRMAEAENLEKEWGTFFERYTPNNTSSRKRGVERGSSSEHLNKKNSTALIEQAAQAAGEGSIVQIGNGQINALVHGWHNTVTVHHHSTASDTRQNNTASLASLRDALYAHYQLSGLSIQRVSGDKVSLADCYINLAIVESQAQREKDKEELKKQASTFERLPSSERLEATNPNKLIALEKLFEVQKLRDGSGGVPKRILIQGRAGIGKTTLCKKLVYEYHQNRLWQDQFESVLWVPLRQLKTHAPKRLEDLLCTQYFAGYESSQAQALSKAFYTHKDKTLFILDGLDEVVGELNEGRPLKDFLQILLNQAHVVITSRPAGVDAKLLGQLDLELETVGFNPANVQAYIEKFVPALNRAAIQQFIHRTPLIQGLVNIPIQLDALCYSWDRLPQNQDVTMSMLYEAMVGKLWRKDSVRVEKKDEDGQLLGDDVIDSLSEADLEELMTAEIDYLGYLAFKGLEAEKIEFSREELSQRRKELNIRPQTGGKLPLSFTTNLKKTSYLHTADGHRLEPERQYHFLHLTFQEYFAAKFLVRYLQTDIKARREGADTKVSPMGMSATPSQEELQAFIAEHKHNPRYEIVWWMVAGLLKDAPLERFFTLLEKAPRDLIGMRHQQVVMGCLSEARDQLNQETVLGLEKELAKWFDFEMKLNGKSTLGRQSAFPEHLLLTALDQSGDRKRLIIEMLGIRPALSDAAEQALIGALQDQDESVRSAAARALEDQSTLSDAAVRALIGALQDQDWNVWSAAARALGGQSTVSDAAVLALIGALQDQNVWYAAAHALGDRTLSDAAVQALNGALQDQNWMVRFGAVSALGRQSRVSDAAVQAFIGALQDENKSVRSAAASALGRQSRVSDAAEQALIGALQDQDESVKSAAARALGCQSTLSDAAVQALIGALQNENKFVRSEAVSALGRQSTVSDATVQALIRAFQDQDEEVRDAAADALGGQSTVSDAAVQALIGALQDQDEEVRSAAASALGYQSTVSDAAVQALIGALQDEDWSVRSAAARALEDQSTVSDAAVQALIGALQDEDWGVRDAAASALGSQSTVSDAAVQALIGALQDQDGSVRDAAASALGYQSTVSDAAVQALIGALQDQDESVRDAAASALGGRTLSEAAVQALVGACQDQDESVRDAAARALGGQSTLSDTAVRALIGALQDQDGNDRDAAARALGSRLERIYTLLPGLVEDQIQRVYRRVLLNPSRTHIAPLYVQENRLHFYTASGPGQPIDLTPEQSTVIIKALRSVRAEAGIARLSEEKPFLMEE
ncbi:MAG: HEAT repeat [Glomeribacter sp. 1016415]|nr:HEAT repeat [Glomeribacter sp. 1016415]